MWRVHVLCTCIHSNQEENEWMCVISAGLHILSRQSIPIKASCSPGDCRGGPCSAGSNHPLKTTKIGWLWLEGNAGSFRNEWGRGGVGTLAPSEPKELETTMAEGGGGLGGEWRGAGWLCVEWGSKLIMWLRLIRWCWGKSVMWNFTGLHSWLD